MNSTNNGQPPGEKELRELARSLILDQNTMTIATGKESLAWAAPVYYASRDFVFYFFSNPSSRHILEALETGQAAAAIFHPTQGWKEIRGIQMTGRIDPLSPGLESLKAVGAYMRKFPFVREFFEATQDLDVDAFTKRFRVRFYRFRPELLYYLDNRIRFSFRERVSL